jgi:pimeloyl-ACP methyl ester carboxylesterase
MSGDPSAGTPPRRGSLQIGNMTLAYLDWGGEGPDVLLLHGITSNAETWWRVAPRLAAEGFRVLGFDMPGHGRSAEATDHRIDSIATLVSSAAVALGARKSVLIGHSWGGAVALALASGSSGIEAERLVMMDPALALTAEAGTQRVPAFTKGLGSSVESLIPAISAANPDWHENDVRWKAQAMHDCRFSAVSGFFTQSGDWDLTPRLGRVNVPLLLLIADPAASIIGDETRIAAERAIDRKRGRVAVVAGTTHNMYRGAGYEPTLAVIMGWLNHG